MIQRSKRLKEFFDSLEEKNETAFKFCQTNWHFLTIFESFLYGLTKDGEINKEFKNLTRKTADKIDLFIREKVKNYIDYNLNEKELHSKNIINFSQN